jgi:hypothetical protein
MTYNRPGVYVNELPLAAAPINGALAATAAGAVIAAFPQGPADTVTRVTSWYDFSQKFGGVSAKYPATYSVRSFFINGGTELYVLRVLPALAKPVAKVAIPNTAEDAGHSFMTIAAKYRGIDGNNIRVKITQSTAVRQSNYYDITVYYEAGTYDYATVGGSTVFSQTNAADDVIVEQFTGVVFDDALSSDYAPTVIGFGSAYIKILEGPVVEYTLNNGTLTSTTTTYIVGDIWSGHATATAPKLDTIYPLSGAPSPEVSLTYGDYTGNYFVSSPQSGYDPVGSSGNIGTFKVDDCLNFTKFEEIDRPLVFFLPDVIAKVANTASSTPAGWSTAKFVYSALIEWVEAPKNNGRHFVVVETASGLSANEALTASGNLSPKSSRAAVYYPHIYIQDPAGRSSGSVRRIGPSGAVVGTYLNTDRMVGPFKTPAGIDAKITDAVAIERAFSPAELDALNSAVTTTGLTANMNAVNAIRNVPGAGIVIMGGRTLKQDRTANRYVNMRRSLTYLEKRLNDLCTFAVFENNTERLWARLTTTIGTFLNEYRNQGGLRGTTIEQSYYIKCDAENNTAATIAAGEVHIEVGVALEYPAEFVVINLSQKTAE